MRAELLTAGVVAAAISSGVALGPRSADRPIDDERPKQADQVYVNL
jgi:hypothetical protein